ncbi:hypothetical protein [Micromonospora sp. WMMD1274]|uniref:hypothetical protein n=1 Tax=Micromonospora sp. WMMD1274 TaxID=3404116 RepID=UPI0013BC927B|nr:hypothetical protein [Micromonospora aurantiaca]
MAARINKIDGIATALRGTALQGHPVEEGPGHTFVVDDVDPGRLLDAWQAAHAAMPITGRWPVFTLPDGVAREPDGDELADLDQVARTLDPWSFYRRYGRDDVQDKEDVKRYVQAFLGDNMVTKAIEELTADHVGSSAAVDL